jgi:hypothetical protein
VRRKVFIQCKGAIDVKERARTSIGSSRTALFALPGPQNGWIWVRNDKNQTPIDSMCCFRQGGKVSLRLKRPLGREKTAMATAVTSATWRNSACCRRRNNDHFTHGYINIMSFNVYNFGYIWFGVRAQNLLRWMAVENRCGLGVRRVDKYSQSHIWTDDGRTLGRALY